MAKYLKPILALLVFAVTFLATSYFLKSFHPIIFSIVGGIGAGYSIYTLALLFLGIWLSRYIFRSGRIDNVKQTIITSGITGIAIGTLIAALIGVSGLLLVLTT